MPQSPNLLLGEFRRTIDDRYRLSLPIELIGSLTEASKGASGEEAILAKERPGCLSLWDASVWQARLEQGVELIKQKIAAGRLGERVGEVQMFGRLLSTRHANVALAGRGRLVIPEGFRDFLGVPPGDEVHILGAAVCIEIWQPAALTQYLGRRMVKFRRLFDRLSR